MSISLKPVSSISVVIENESNKERLLVKKFSSVEEYYSFIDKYGKSVSSYSLLKSTLIPLRTDNWKDFAKDIFLPTFVNHALRINNFVLRIFASIFALTLDVITFIPRVIVSPFRAIYNHKNHKNKIKHPLISLIENNPHSAESIKSGIVKLRVKFQDIKTFNEGKMAHQFKVEGYMTVAIKALPFTKRKSKFNEQFAIHNKLGNTWDKPLIIKATVKYLRFNFNSMIPPTCHRL